MWLQAKQGPHEVTFTASPVDQPSRNCVIEVRDDAGRPVAGVALVMHAARGGSEVRGTTDADGKVTMHTPLPVGSRAVLVSLDDRWVTDQDKPELPVSSRNLRNLGQHEFVVDPERVEPVKVVAASSVRGRLLQHDGRPAAYAWVELQEQSANRQPEWMGTVFTATDRDGCYVLPRLHGTAAAVRVSTRTAIGSWEGSPLDLTRPGTAVRLGDARLAKPAMLEGVLRDAEERPVGGVRVRRLDWDPSTRCSNRVDEVLTDAQGRYRFLGVACGGAWLQCKAEPAEDHAWTKAVEPFEVEAGKTYRFDLQLPAAR